MPRFNGLTDTQWALLEPLMPKPPARKRAGRPRNDWRKLMNSIFWVMLSGSRWCDLPIAPQFAKKTASNFWLARFKHDGTLEKVFGALRDLARLSNQIDWQRLAVDGSFSPVQGPRARRRLRPQGQGVHHSSGG